MGGSQSVPKVTAQDRAILDLKLQRDKLKQYQKKIQVVLDREKEIAKQHLATGQKDRALIALRRRKYQQSMLVKTEEQMTNLEQLVSTIEFSLIEVSVLHGLKQGNDVLKEIHREMNVESVEKLLEETAEAQAYQREIDEMLANTLSREDEEEVEAELKQLQAEALPQQADAEPKVKLPNAPTAEPIVGQPEAEPEEATLQRERVAIPA
ncbi:hypothetical protein JAAARDRAFT_53723 [Jaapia argillacea MUCL 33604]|uniref:Charged multivesicular body protein 6 n=1 Tax=Jaapia argillacea MUCL 33604 TaxID=933084 RepID=A0A067Q8Z7_9AGAM|nr:hypothetical protein JAAARDRAFT_53723 [Jaapia argillacea MUCL 33604]